MKKGLFFIAMVLFMHKLSCAQEYKYKYNLDLNFLSTSEKDALFIGKGIMVDSCFKLDCFNKFDNSLIMSLHFKDSTLSEMNGSFKSLYKNGILESKGVFKNNLEEGVWLKRDSSGLLTDSTYYEAGVRLSYAKFEYNKYKQLSTFEFTDSIKNTYEYISFDSTGAKMLDVNFLGNNGIYNKYDSGKVITTKVFTREMIEAKCERFKKYLETNLRSSIGMDSGAKAGAYQVIIKFIVNINGSISDIEAETKFGFGMEKEAIRVIKNSPKWTAASFFGIPVKAYRRQPITFVYAGY
jgi:antitoxin component YwqK of YwqJK toxin-antitoxin module